MSTDSPLRRVSEYISNLDDFSQVCMDYILQAHVLQRTSRRNTFSWLRERFKTYRYYRRVINEGKNKYGFSAKETEEKILKIDTEFNHAVSRRLKPVY